GTRGWSLGSGMVDSGAQRQRVAFEASPPGPPPHEGAQVLVVARAPRQGEIEGHPELAAPREEPGLHERAELRRRQKLEPVWQRVQTSGTPHEHLPEPIVGADKPILDAETAAEIEG